MPLSTPAPREPLHTRAITINGFHRADGLYDIEAHLEDTKAYAFDMVDRGTITPGTPLHGMWARMTINEDMLIVAFEADTEYGPFSICPQAAPNFARLAGLRIAKGFLREANQRIGGVHGCTHLRELLGQMATTAFQTLVGVRLRRAATTEGAPTRPPLLGTCLAYAPDSPVVKRNHPAFYTGPNSTGPNSTGPNSAETAGTGA